MSSSHVCTENNNPYSRALSTILGKFIVLIVFLTFPKRKEKVCSSCARRVAAEDQLVNIID